MKIWVFDKYSLLTGFLMVLLTALVIPLTFQQAVEVTAVSREIPIYSVDRSDNVIAITFDCAWNADDIDEILAVLKEKKCRATFFVLGTWAERYPEAVKKIHADGHEIANHSYNHTYYTTLSKEGMAADMDKCDAVIDALIPSHSTLFRAPSGDYNNAVVQACRESGRTYIQWDVDSLDYKGLNEEQMCKRIFDKVQSGSILLFHNGTEHTAAALPGILDRLMEEGYSFAAVGDLIYTDSYTVDHTGRQLKHVS